MVEYHLNPLSAMKNKYPYMCFAASLQAGYRNRIERLLFPCAKSSQIHGIRYHVGFATELYGLPDHREFTRALNARSIMGIAIPDMTTLDEAPYCVWYPDLAAETTYREFARWHSQIR